MKEIEKIDVLSLIPQRRPFVMIDKVIHCDPVVTITSLKIGADNIFADDDRLQPYGLAENVAQTCAARIGYMNLTAGESVKLGFIGAIRNMEFSRLPKVGESLTTRIEVTQEVFNMTLVNATICVGDECLLQCEMKIALGAEASMQ